MSKKNNASKLAEHSASSKHSLKAKKSVSFLSVSFGRLTSSNSYNEKEAKKGAEKGFLNRFFDTVRIITSIKSNDVPNCKLLNDKINIGELYGGVYCDNGCGFELGFIDKFCSVNLSSKHKERLIGTIDRDNNVFYVLAIDFHHDAYNHGS